MALAKVLERFLPTHQDLARLNSVVAERGAALRSLIHSLQVLNTALATKQTQIVQLVDSSSKVFHAFANANQGISRAVADLPGTLDQTTATLQKDLPFVVGVRTAENFGGNLAFADGGVVGFVSGLHCLRDCG